MTSWSHQHHIAFFSSQAHVPGTLEEQLWSPPPAPWDQVCLCFIFLLKACRDSDVLWDVHINRLHNLRQSFSPWNVEGSLYARQLKLKMSWQCAKDWRNVLDSATYFFRCEFLWCYEQWVALPLVRNADIAVNARTPEWSTVACRAKCCCPVGCPFSSLQTGHACLCHTCWNRPSTHIFIDHKDNFSANAMIPCRHVDSRSLLRDAVKEALLPDTEMYGCIFFFRFIFLFTACIILRKKVGYYWRAFPYSVQHTQCATLAKAPIWCWLSVDTNEMLWYEIYCVQSKLYRE